MKLSKIFIFFSLILFFFMILTIDCSKQSRKEKKEKKREKKRKEQEEQLKRRKEQEAKYASQYITKRPNFITPELWCNTCEGIIRTIIPKLKSSRSETDIIVAMQRTCRLVNFQNYDFEPSDMKATCEHFWSEWEEVLETELQYRRSDESFEKDFCHEKTKACQGILTGNDRFQTEDITDQFKEKTVDANFTTRTISPDEIQVKDITEEYKARMQGSMFDGPMTPEEEKLMEKRRKKWAQKQKKPKDPMDSESGEEFESNDDSTDNSEDSSDDEDSEYEQKKFNQFDYQAQRNREQEQEQLQDEINDDTDKNQRDEL